MHQSSLDNMERVINHLTPYLEKENDIFDLGGILDEINFNFLSTLLQH